MIVKGKALIGHFDNPQPILDLIPKAKYFKYKGMELVAVPHTLEVAHVLKNIGYTVPSPITTQYDWPGMFTPFKHQITTADFLTMNRRCFCLNEMRTGKTGASIWAADFLRRAGYIDEIWVICPVSVTGVWAKEAFRLTPHLPTDVLMGTRAKRLKLLAGDAPIKVINFDGLVSIRDEVIKHTKNKRILIIVDEAATYRTYGNDRYKALKAIIQPSSWLWLLTGTPTPNAPTDAWALAKLVNPKSVPASFKVFQETVMRPAGPYKWVPKPGAEQIAFNVLQPGIRFMRADVLDVTQTMQFDREAEMSSEQRKAYENFRKKMRHEDSESGIEITAANAAVRLLKIQQVFCGIVKDDAGCGVRLDNTSRLELTREIIEQNGGKAIVFVPFKFSMAQLEEYLGEEYRVAVVNGDTPSSKRNEYFSGFQSDDIDVLIAHPGTTAHGLDLSASSTVIWFAPTFSYELYAQANARIEGPNQKESCGIYHIGCHPMEWKIYDAVATKQKSSTALLSLYKQYIAS